MTPLSPQATVDVAIAEFLARLDSSGITQEKRTEVEGKLRETLTLQPVGNRDDSDSGAIDADEDDTESGEG